MDRGDGRGEELGLEGGQLGGQRLRHGGLHRLGNWGCHRNGNGRLDGERRDHRRRGLGRLGLVNGCLLDALIGC